MHVVAVKKLPKQAFFRLETSKNATKTVNSGMKTGLIAQIFILRGNGARYLDPKTSRWISADPAMGEYIPLAPVNDNAKKHNGNLPGMGGVFNLVNMHVYHYSFNNPIRYTDPDGREGEIGVDINLFSKTDPFYELAQKIPHPEGTIIVGGHGNEWFMQDDSEANARGQGPYLTANGLANKIKNLEKYQKLREAGGNITIILVACEVGGTLLYGNGDSSSYAQEVADALGVGVTVLASQYSMTMGTDGRVTRVGLRVPWIDGTTKQNIVPLSDDYRPIGDRDGVLMKTFTARRR